MQKKHKVYCDEHGYRHIGVMCRHLCVGEGLRFHAIKFEANHPAVCQLWCRECHSVLEREGGLTDRALRYMGLAAVCMPCVKLVARRNKRIPLPA
jgi:hypothetical protein